MGRRLFQILVAVWAAAAPLALAAPAARADDAGNLLVMVNNLRASHGQAPLAASATLNSVAQAWSAHMAATNALSHNPNLASQAGGGWTKLGENVAGAGNITAVFNAFVNSAFHLGNMLDPAYNVTGIGVAVGSGGTLWVTEDFEGLPGATPGTTATIPAPSNPTTPTTTARRSTATAPATSATTTPPLAPATPVASTTTVPPTTVPATTTTAPVASPATAAPKPTAPASRGLAAAAAVVGPAGAGPSRSAATWALSAIALVALAVALLNLHRWPRRR